MGLFRRLLVARGLATKRRKLSTDPTPGAYADLARGYASMNDYQAVVRICEEGLQHFAGAAERQKCQSWVGRNRFAIGHAFNR